MSEGFSEEEQEILAARTRSLAARPEIPEERRELPVVSVGVVGERYAIDAQVVHGVIAVDRITPLPHAPPHVSGLVMHAGQVLPAFHLAGVLELPLAALPEHGQVLLVGERAVELALVVDGVVGLQQFDADALDDAPATLGPGVRALLRGIGPDAVPVLNGERLLASERLVVDISIPFDAAEAEAGGA